MTDLERLKQTYITESTELLLNMEQYLLALNCDAPDEEQLNAIFRCANSIKGGSGAFGCDYITHFTHAMETLLDSLRSGKLKPTREIVDALLASADIVTQMVDYFKNNASPPEGLGDDIVETLSRLTGPAVAAPGHDNDKTQVVTQAAAGDTDYQISFVPHKDLLLSGNEPLLLLRELARLGKCILAGNIEQVPDIQALDPTVCFINWTATLRTARPESDIREVFEFVDDRCDLKIEKITESVVDQVKKTGKEKQNSGSVAVSAVSTIRVDLEKVDRLVNMVGELVIAEAMIKEGARPLMGDERFSGLLRGIESLAHHARELQEAVMSVRMQPVGSIFSRMQRVVRDLSSQLEKDIKLVISGEGTEIDKTIIEQLSDPLTHMIRNSADHGIENPARRVAAGKPAQGVINLSACQRNGRIVIEISDDGAGINREKVLIKAKEKGLVDQDAQLTDDECDNLIFLPGFSTADQISNVSGRGVGMDVAKRNIESLGGTLHLKSEFGKGSLFTISLPLTLAILEGMIVRIGTESYIIPMTSIIEMLRPRAEDVHRIEGKYDVMNLRNEFIPLLYLADVFGVSGAEKAPHKAMVVLVESHNRKIGLVVDELLGQQQVVIKSLTENTNPIKGVSGATILGDGRVSLILEVSELGRVSDQDNRSSQSEDGQKSQKRG